MHKLHTGSDLDLLCRHRIYCHTVPHHWSADYEVQTSKCEVDRLVVKSQAKRM